MGSLLAAGLLVEGDAPLDGRRMARRVGAGHAHDVFLVDPGALAQLVEVHVGDALADCLEAVDPLVAEFLVIELLVADDLQHGHGECSVSAGADAQPVLASASREPGELRVDDGNLHAALHEVQDPMAVEAVSVGVEGLMAPHDAVLGHRVAGIVIALGQKLRAVHNAGAAEHARHGRDARQVAGVASEVGDALVRRAHARVQARDLVNIAARALAHSDFVGAVGVGDLLELLDDDVVGLIPGDFDELVLAAIFLRTLHRVQKAVFMVDVVGDAKATAAKTALVVGVLGIAFDLHELAVLHVGQNAADVVASRCGACRAADDGHAVLFPLPGHLRRFSRRRCRDGVGLLGKTRASAILLSVGFPPVLLHRGLGRVCHWVSSFIIGIRDRFRLSMLPLSLAVCRSSHALVRLRSQSARFRRLRSYAARMRTYPR